MENIALSSEEHRVLVAYFSATGTTEAQAKAIAGATHGTLCEIAPAVRYTTEDLNWRDKRSRSTSEMIDVNSRPEIGGEQVDASEYDIVFIGYPIWWYVCPRVVNTWIESQALAGKKVVPFATSGSSEIENSVKVLREQYPDIDWQDGRLVNCKAEEAAEWGRSLVMC